jgi:cyclin-dependent kinase-like
MGDIIQRHVQIFKSNQFFRGMNIPEPEETISLQQKLPNVSRVVIDFLMVVPTF